MTTTDLDAFLAQAVVDPAVLELRPDYRVLLLAVDGLDAEAATSADAGTERLLQAAEAAALQALGGRPPEELPHVAAWREAYRGFGAKPQRTRNSLEALLRRVGSGLPRVNPLTDVYNAVSVLHQVPLGGEDLSRYEGSPRLVRADGTESFETIAEGGSAVEHPEVGEVVWRDDAGVTCRRWNWRQCRRTQLTPGTTTALFLLDALAPMDDAALQAAGEHLVEELSRLGAGLRVSQRLLRAGEER